MQKVYDNKGRLFKISTPSKNEVFIEGVDGIFTYKIQELSE